MNWNDAFEYHDGHLYWKPRCESNFSSTRACKSWNSRRSGKPAGTVSSARRARVRHIQIIFEGRRIYAHRVIWEMHFGEIPDGMQIDHIDGNGCNNLLKNLRLVTAEGNRKNQPLRKDNKSGLFGVRWWAARNRFETYIDSGGQRIRLGLYETLLDAASVRKSAELTLGFSLNHGRIGDNVTLAKE